MKKIIILISLIISFNGIAQNLEHIIPNNAQAVVTINGDQIFDLISISEIDNLSVTKEIVKSVKENGSITDLGFNLKSKAHYFYQTTDSVQYHNFIVNLTSKNKFEKILSESDRKDIEEYAGYKFLYEHKMVTVWNDNIMIISAADMSSKSYDYSYNDYESSSDVVEEVEEVPVEASEHIEKAKDAAKQAAEEIEETIIESTEPEEKNDVIDGLESKYPSVTKVENYESRYDRRNREAKELLKNNVLTILNGKSKNSIITNKSYISGKNKNASAYFWIGNYSKLVGNYLKSEMRFLSSIYGDINPTENLFGINEVRSNLFFNDDEVKLATEARVADSWKSIYKKIYDGKLDKKFYRYINKNETLAYFSLATNSQAALEEYPKMVTNIYGSIMPKIKEEVSVAAEFISVILDEKAIGELITGDALFVLNDISEKEVTYTSYTYDDDYNRKEVTKTKMEVIPDFTIMIGSENKSLITKMMKLATKHKVAVQNSNYFKFDKNLMDAPFDLFFVVKNDIAFLTNSQKQINNVVSNHYPTNLGKHKKMLKNSISTFYMDTEKIMNKVPKSSLSSKELNLLGYVQENVKETYLTSSRLKGNKFKSEYIIKTSGKKRNSLKLILDMIEEFSK